jgi:hypothetical protein
MPADKTSLQPNGWNQDCWMFFCLGKSSPWSHAVTQDFISRYDILTLPLTLAHDRVWWVCKGGFWESPPPPKVFLSPGNFQRSVSLPYLGLEPWSCGATMLDVFPPQQKLPLVTCSDTGLYITVWYSNRDTLPKWHFLTKKTVRRVLITLLHFTWFGGVVRWSLGG